MTDAQRNTRADWEAFLKCPIEHRYGVNDELKKLGEPRVHINEYRELHAGLIEGKIAATSSVSNTIGFLALAVALAAVPFAIGSIMPLTEAIVVPFIVIGVLVFATYLISVCTFGINQTINRVAALRIYEKRKIERQACIPQVKI